MRRRSVLSGMAVAALTGGAAHAQAETVIPLWPGTPPGPGRGPGGSGVREALGRHGIVVRHVATPSLLVVRPAHPTGAAMLIAAGGGYRVIETGTEAMPAATWLAGRGVTSYVLRYRLPGEGWAPAAPLQDAQRAMRLIRTQPGTDPAKIGVLGFSAGGHLLGLEAACAGQALYAPADAADALPARPALAGLIYPVISLLPPNDHTQTGRQLAGSDPALEAKFSVERHVTAAMPPVFLAQAIDDPVSPVDNTRLMAAACRAAGVPVEVHLFQTGGHGWGMGHGETAQWPGLFASWLQAHSF
jgi:acetyl esterase/lipase